MAKKNQPNPKSFEEALRELESILAEIETGQIGLEESLAKYERGNFLIQHCRSVLGAAEKQIELLSRSTEGDLVKSPLEEPAATPEDKAGMKSE
jgi:exodeoxyribonuclease VII small subunit